MEPQFPWLVFFGGIGSLIFSLTAIVNCRKLIKRRKKRTLEDFKKPFPDLDKDFIFESIDVITEDGYFLTLFNLRHRTHYNSKKRPILMRHNLTTSATMWLLSGEKYSPALKFASQG